MSIFKRTESMLMVTNMCVDPKSIEDGEFKIADVIRHLQDNKRTIIGLNPINEDLFYVCKTALLEKEDESILMDHTSIIKERSNVDVRSFFYPSCRIIRIDLSNSAKAIQGLARPMSKSLNEYGYQVGVKSGFHSVLIIKIERMTDASCFASWTLVK